MWDSKSQSLKSKKKSSLNFQNEDFWVPPAKDSDSFQSGIRHRNLYFSQVPQVILKRSRDTGGRLEDFQGRNRYRIHAPAPRMSSSFTNINCSPDSEAKKSSPKSNLYLCYVRKKRIRMVLQLHLQPTLTTLSSNFDNSIMP